MAYLTLGRPAAWWPPPGGRRLVAAAWRPSGAVSIRPGRGGVAAAWRPSGAGVRVRERSDRG